MPAREDFPTCQYHEDDGKKLHGLTFIEWRDAFLVDAKLHGCFENASGITDLTLRLFWREDVAPTVTALLASAEGDNWAA